MKLVNLYKQILQENNSPNEFGCVMIYFKFPEFKEIQKIIDKEDIDEVEGLEHEPHTTLLYGLHEEVTLEDIKNILNNFEYSEYHIHNASLFENPEYDVLKFDVKGDNLKQTNKALAKLPHTNKFKNYIPHLTVGYLNPGSGKKYTKELQQKSYELLPDYVVYSTKDKIKTKIKIKVVKSK